jgi:uncharacterized membrane protein
MTWLLTNLWPGGRWIAAAACAAAVLHILLTLATPQVLRTRPSDKLAAGVAKHKMTILPAVSPANQKLPFMTADALVAVCPFDTNEGPVSVTASLPAPGWSLALFSPEGENFYVAVAQPGRPTAVSLLLTASDDRFTGLTPQSRGLSPRDAAQLKVPAERGVVVLRAPDQGPAYRTQNLAIMGRAQCSNRAADNGP